MPPETPSAITLDYDTLPAGSRLRREVSADGTVTISLAGGELSDADRARAMRQSATSSALYSGLLCGIIAGAAYLATGRDRRLLALPHSLLIALTMAAGVFVAAMFVLLWRLKSDGLIQRWQRAAAQSTVLSGQCDGELFVESTGPCGTISSQLTPQLIRVGRTEAGIGFSVEMIDAAQKPIRIFDGVTRGEADWIARALRSRKGS